MNALHKVLCESPAHLLEGILAALLEFTRDIVKINLICLPTEHQGVHKNSFRSVRAFQDRIGICKCCFLKGEGKTGVPGIMGNGE